MKLDVLLALRNPGTEYAFSVEQELAPQDVSGSEVSFDVVKLTGKLVAGEDGSVTVEGKLSTVAHSQCAKCLAPAISAVEGDFRETFIHGGDPEDDESFAYNGGSLDFNKLTLFYVLLNLPMRFLCEGGCEGLGQYAGTDVISKTYTMPIHLISIRTKSREYTDEQRAIMAERLKAVRN